jgi:hypothetical protein
LTQEEKNITMQKNKNNACLRQKKSPDFDLLRVLTFLFADFLLPSARLMSAAGAERLTLIPGCVPDT